MKKAGGRYYKTVLQLAHHEDPIHAEPIVEQATHATTAPLAGLHALQRPVHAVQQVSIADVDAILLDSLCECTEHCHVLPEQDTDACPDESHRSRCIVSPLHSLNEVADVEICTAPQPVWAQKAALCYSRAIAALDERSHCSTGGADEHRAP